MFEKIWQKTKTILDAITAYWMFGAAALIGIVWMRTRNKRETKRIEVTNNKIASETGQLSQLKDEQDVKQNEFNETDSNYESLLRDNAELARKLGIGPNS